MMPSYSFSVYEFVPKILDGSKPHTIRPRRKNRTKAGDVLTLYFKQRTAECRVICLTQCSKVTPMVIYPESIFVKKSGRVLSIETIEKLARADGFDRLDSFFGFFERYNTEKLETLELVEWDPKKKVNLWDMDPDYFRGWIQPMSARERLAWLVDQAGE